MCHSSLLPVGGTGGPQLGVRCLGRRTELLMTKQSAKVCLRFPLEVQLSGIAINPPTMCRQSPARSLILKLINESEAGRFPLCGGVTQETLEVF